MTRLLLVLPILLVLDQMPTESPTLSEVNRLKLQEAVHRMEIAQLKAQIAQRDFDTAKTDYDALMGTLKIEGWTLDLSTLTYQKVPDKSSIKDKELP